MSGPDESAEPFGVEEAVFIRRGSLGEIQGGGIIRKTSHSRHGPGSHAEYGLWSDAARGSVRVRQTALPGASLGTMAAVATPVGGLTEGKMTDQKNPLQMLFHWADKHPG